MAEGQPFEMEFPLRGADGRFRQFLTRAVPLKDTEGRVVQWFGTNTDVEESRRAAEALRESNEELARFNRAAVGRELRMIELKTEINTLCARAGEPPRYALHDEEEPP